MRGRAMLRYAVMLVIFLQWWAGPVWAQSDHGKPAAAAEVRARDSDARRPFIVIGCEFAVPASSLTFAATACEGYVQDGDELPYSKQGAVAVTLPNVNGTHWIVLFKDTFGVPIGWSALGFGTRYRSQQVTVRPVDPDGGIVVTEVTVAGGIITAADNFIGGSNAQRQVFRLTDPVLGGVCDGVTDDSAALQKANTLPQGSLVVLPLARCVLASTVTFTKRIDIRGQGMQSELSCTMGAGTNCLVSDAGGAAGAVFIRDMVWSDFSVIGGASSADNCMVIRNHVLPLLHRIHVICGTPVGGYALWAQDFVLEADIDEFIISGSAHESPFGTSGDYALPANGIKMTTAPGDTVGTFNVNRIKADITSVAVGVFIKTVSPNGNNRVEGTYQALTDAAVKIEGGTQAWLYDLHLERGGAALGNNIVVIGHSQARIGPKVFVANSIATEKHIQLVDADRTKIDGYVGGVISIDNASADVIIGEVVTSAFAGATVEDDGVNTHYLQPVGGTSALIRFSGVHADGSSYLINGSAERRDNVTFAPPGSWGFAGSPPTFSREATIIKHGLFSLRVDGVTTSAQPSIVVLTAAQEPLLRGQQVAVSGWIFIPTTGGVDITPQFLFDGGVATAGLPPIISRDIWTHIAGTFEVGAGGHTSVVLRMLPSAGSGTLYLDGWSAVPSLTGTASWYTQNPDEYASFDVSLTVDPPSTATGNTGITLGLVVPGALANDFCQVGPPVTVLADVFFSCFVTAADTVEMRTHVVGPSTRDPVSATYNIRVTRRP